MSEMETPAQSDGPVTRTKTPVSHIPRLTSLKKTNPKMTGTKSQTQPRDTDVTPWSSAQFSDCKSIQWTGSTKPSTRTKSQKKGVGSVSKPASSLMNLAKKYANVIPSDEQLIEQIESKMPDFEVTANNLRNPTPEFVIMYYCRVLQELKIDLDSIMFPRDEQLHGLSYPDAYDCHLNIMDVYCTVRDIYARIGLDDFLLSDIIEPRADRMKPLIFMMDNFHNYADNRVSELQPLFDELLEKHDALQDLLRRQNELREKLYICENETENSDFFEQLEKEYQELLAEETALERRKVQISDEIKEVHANIGNENQKNAQIRNFNCKLGSEAIELRGKIIESPEALLKQIEQLKEEVKRAEEETNSIKSKKEENKKLIENIKTVISEQEARLKNLHTLQIQDRTISSMHQELVKINEEMENLKPEKLLDEICQYKEEKALWQEKVTKYEHQYEKEVTELQIVIDTYKKDASDFASQKKKNKISMSYKLKDCAHELDDLTEQFNAKVALFRQMNERIEKMGPEFHKKLDKMLDDVFGEMKKESEQLNGNIENGDNSMLNGTSSDHESNNGIEET